MGEKAIPGVDAGDEKAVKKAKEGLKRQLPIRAIHYSKFGNNHRSSEDADPESFLFQTTIDVDDVDYVDAALEKARELNCSNTIWKGKLLHLEYSARKKLHIDIRMPMGMTIEETQKAYCEAAGIPYDKSCITPERIIFITDKDSEIYRSKEWYGGCCRMRRLRPAERLFSSVGLRSMEGGRLATACLPGIANPRNAWRGTFEYFKFKIQIQMFKTIDLGH